MLKVYATSNPITLSVFPTILIPLILASRGDSTSYSTIILVLPITEYFLTTNCFLSLNSPATTICFPSSTSARKFKLCAAIKQFTLFSENRTKGVLLIFNTRIFETTPFNDFTLIASVFLHIIMTISFD